MKKTFLLLAVLLSVTTSFAQKKSMDQYIDDLMAKMTLDEKVGQLNLLPGGDITTGAGMNSPLAALIQKGELGSVLNVMGVDKAKALQELAVKKSRLGIPLLIGQDVIHGYETIFPIPLAQGCSWDPQAVELGARVAAKEASADGVNWVYSPMVDVAHDPRWGRVSEGYGEDPYLSGVMGAAAVRGYQNGEYPVAACLKHYALYGATEAGKDYSSVDMSRLRMYNQYLPPYKAAVDAGVWSVMSSFNLVDGVPATGNEWLINHVLRDQWGFKGFLVTDYGSIGEMPILGFGDLKTSTIQAFKAGTDMDMCSNAYTKYLKEALNEGSITMAQIDTAVRRVLEAKYKLGLFSDPYRYCNVKRGKTDMYNSDSRKAARDMAAETFVLLKNDNNILPLKRQGTIALVGPLADTRNNIPGTWCFAYKPELYSTIKESMQRYLGNSAKLVYAQGSNIYADSTMQANASFGKTIKWGDSKKMLDEAVEAAKSSDVVVACLGELAEMSGESSTRTNLNLPDVQKNLLKALLATGKPVVLLNFSGRPTILTWESQNVPAIMNVWFGGSETGDALCDVLFGDKVPTGKLVNTLPRSMGQIPIFYNHLSGSRDIPDGSSSFRKYQSNYIDETTGPLYPFGYGLSYTTYKYSDVSLSAPSMSKEGKVTATVNVTNTGDRDGDEVVEFYIHGKTSHIVRPVKELKGFQRVHIAKGETKTISFDIDANTLNYLDAEGKPFLDPGDFEIMIGPNSRDVKTAELRVD